MNDLRTPNRPPTKPTPNQIQTAQQFDIGRSLKDNQKSYEAVLPKGLSIDRFFAAVINAYKTNPKLQSCDRGSLFMAVRQAAELGLEPGGALGHGWLLPYKGMVKFITGYRGWIVLAKRTGNVNINIPRVVYEGDRFEFQFGYHEDIQHFPNKDLSEEDPAKITHVYVTATLPDGTRMFEVLPKWKIDLARSCSESANSEYSPWKRFYDEMAKKTVIKALAKILPIESEQWSRALEVDNEDGIFNQSASTPKKTLNLLPSKKEEPRQDEIPPPPAEAEDVFREPGQEG
jgi:recombination protein RecT